MGKSNAAHASSIITTCLAELRVALEPVLDEAVSEVCKAEETLTDTRLSPVDGDVITRIVSAFRFGAKDAFSDAENILDNDIADAIVSTIEHDHSILMDQDDAKGSVIIELESRISELEAQVQERDVQIDRLTNRVSELRDGAAHQEGEP